jgi:hypothetical protein
MEIIRQVKEIIGWIIKQIIFQIVTFMVLAAAPLLYVTAPISLVWSNPNADLGWLGVLYAFSGPFACAFWMVIICHWHTVRKAQREGRLKNWRDREGGMGNTVAKSIGFMFLGFFGSALAEAVFLVVLAQFEYHGALGKLLSFEALALVIFTPVWAVVLLRRCQRSRKGDALIRREKYDRDQLRAASHHAKNLRNTPTDHGSHYELC